MYDCGTVLRYIFALVFNGIAGASNGTVKACHMKYK